jgi:alpha-glucoside transport system permease protein
MTQTPTRTKTDASAPATTGTSLGERWASRLGNISAKGLLLLLVVIWTIPSLGLFITSFRTEEDIRFTGWWTFFGDISPVFYLGLAVAVIGMVTLWYFNRTLPEGQSKVWPAYLIGLGAMVALFAAIFSDTTTFENYSRVLSASGSDAPNMWEHALNSLAIVLPATVIPISIAAFAAYAFSWMEWKGRDWVFVAVVSLMAVPLQMGLIPLLQLYSNGAHLNLFGWELTLFPDLNLNGKALSVWLTHTGFGLPLAIFLLRNYMSTLPRDIMESARIDGADHYTIFFRLVLPLSVPALAAFAIFQFLWTWNDYLIALTFVGGAEDVAPMTVRLANLVGSRGQDWEVLTAGAFVTSLLPLIIFFSLQRYFVRGLLAGSVKG